MIETGWLAKSASRVSWVVKVAGRMFVTPETVALAQDFPRFQNKLAFYLAYPRVILIRPPQIPGKIRTFCSRTEFPPVKARVREDRGQTRSRKKPIRQELPKQSHFQVPTNRASTRDQRVAMMRQNGKCMKLGIHNLLWTYLLGAIALLASASFALF